MKTGHGAAAVVQLRINRVVAVVVIIRDGVAVSVATE